MNAAHLLGLGLIGCGRVTQHYRKILARHPVGQRVRVAACCDPRRETAVDMAATYNATVHDTMEALLADPAVDLAVVLTPSGLHYEHARAALEAGKHVLVEKPVTLIPQQAEALQQLAREKGRICAVVFQNRYNPAIRALRRAMDAGRFGKLITASIRLRWCRYQPYYEDGWHGTWAMDGGVINQQAIHHVDALNWLCGPVVRCCARHTRRLNHLEAEDTLVAVLEFEGGALGTIEVTTAARPKDFEAAISVVGEKGMVSIGDVALNRIDLWQFVEPLPEDADTPRLHSEEVETGYGWGHGPLLEDLVNRWEQGNLQPAIDAMEGVKAVRLIHALYASAEQGGWVTLADQPQSGLLGRRA